MKQIIDGDSITAFILAFLLILGILAIYAAVLYLIGKSLLFTIFVVAFGVFLCHRYKD